MPKSLCLIESHDAATALAAALRARADGGVPLITDPRAPSRPDPDLQLPDTVAWAALTSGTTGDPKIVVRTEASWSVAFGHLNRELGLTAGQGLWLPVHQVSSIALFTAAWAEASGLRLIVPEAGRPGLDSAIAAHVTPTWLSHLLDLLDGGQPSTVRTVLVGGDSLAPHLLNRARAAGLRVVPYAGAAELSLVAWDTGRGLRAFPEVNTQIVNGELWVASPQLALDVIGGTLRTQVCDGLRWATVGDRVTEVDGVLEFLGRADGAILTAGATVLPADVETEINRHPSVRASLVLGRPDAVLGQRVIAWVETDAEPQVLRDWARRRLPKAARPVQIHRVERLARTASGKIRRVAPEES